VAVRLAVKPAAVYRLVAKGLLVVVRIGSLLRFRREDVEAFVVGGGVA
jgi:excisionase family DNA binding protein